MINAKTVRVPIKALSVNKCWRGGPRFRTADYNQYEKDLSVLLPPIEVPDGPITLYITLGLSNKGQDADGAIKPLFDVLQHKYHFNDNRIYKFSVEKKIVKKGEEFISFTMMDYII